MASRPRTSGRSTRISTIEATGAKQRAVEDLGAIGGGHDDQARPRREPVHLDEQLVEGLLALLVGREASGTRPRLSDRVELVDEDDARPALLGLLEEVAYPARADADEHLDELRPAHREERDAGLARDGSREQGLARPRRTHEQDALRHVRPHRAVPGRLAEKSHDLHQLGLRLVDPGDVGERHRLLGAPVVELGLAPAERHGAAAGAPLRQPSEPPQREREREQGESGPDERPPLGCLLAGDDDVLRLELFEQGVVVHVRDAFGDDPLAFGGRLPVFGA